MVINSARSFQRSQEAVKQCIYVHKQYLTDYTVQHGFQLTTAHRYLLRIEK